MHLPITHKSLSLLPKGSENICPHKHFYTNVQRAKDEKQPKCSSAGKWVSCSTSQQWILFINKNMALIIYSITWTLWTECWCPQKFLCWNPSAQSYKSLEMEHVWGNYVLRVKILIMGLVPLLGETWERALLPLSLPYEDTQQEDVQLQARKRALTRTHHTGTLISGFQPPELWEYKLLLFRHPVDLDTQSIF